MEVTATCQTVVNVSELEISEIFPLKTKKKREGGGKTPKFRFGTEQPLCPGLISSPLRQAEQVTDLSCCH